MREIIFRGKRCDNGEWVYGNLIHEPFGDCIQYLDENEGVYRRCKAKIIPETVGQYTGYTDEYAKKIFEGDILRVDDSDCFGNDRTSTIVLDDMTDAPTMVGLHFAHHVEVIGNIHDQGVQ